MKRVIGCIAGGLLLLAGSAWAGDWTWEMTTRMEMPGMPMAMPAQKNTLCIAEGKEAEAGATQEPGCKVLDTSTSGKITRLTVRCKEGTMKMEHEQMSPERWRSKMQMTGAEKGEEVTMLTEARRLGACNVAKDGSMPKEVQAQLAQNAKEAKAAAEKIGRDCQRDVDQWPGSSGAFVTYEHMAKTRQDMLKRGSGPDTQRLADAAAPEIPACAKAKASYCAKAKAALGEMASRRGYVDAMRKAKPASGVNAALSYCGAGDPAPLLAGHCKSAISDSDFGFIAGYCPEERRVLARQHCAGRSYTAIEARYRVLCGGSSGGADAGALAARGALPESQSRTGAAGTAAAGRAAEENAAPAQDAPAQSSPAGAVEQGMKALKGFLKF